MAISVQMPALGESVTEGTVTRWLKQVGDRVEVDEPLLEVSTDKVDTEIPSPAAGVLQKIVAQEDETVAVGGELAVIGDSAEGGNGGSTQAQQSPAQQSPPAEQPAPETRGEGESDSSGPQLHPESPQAASGRSGTPVTMPALGESVTEGTVTRWLKQVGDTVEADEPLLEVSTDKVDTEIPSPVAGTLLQIVAGEDQTVEVGGQLAIIGEAGGDADAKAPAPPKEEPDRQQAAEQAPEPAPAQAQQPQPKPDPQPEPQVTTTDGAAAGGTPYVTPLVRKLAAENDIDLSTLTGTGIGGRIRKQDVLAAAEAAKARAAAPAPAAQPTRAAAPAPAKPSPQAAALRGKTEKMTRLRQVVARRMVESLQTAAQLTQVVEVDVTRIAKLRNRAKNAFEQREGVKLTFLPFFAKAAVEALKQHPKLNASIDNDTLEVTYHAAEHLGIAVDTERGLLSPALHNAGDLSLAGLARGIADLAERTRANKVTPDELAGATFTLTNLGSQGALFDTPIIPVPQVGILGVGLVVKRPVVITDADGDDTIAVRSMVYLALTYDHRLVDGADAGRFLTTVKRRLQDGNFEADLGL
ncbi:MAG TPA: 2-oxoglutarate dehydrogenase, E2 component, dihydrolipoamide succinyltransferase [Actinophytocola sp.]|uniref:2-oxoglutarate dehydrogenase, E2 component, dihydrolipoamide succinyltransferase n=1 Tax=Actinophytocola sp. TaxID=1872138 RepID=UPI002DDD4025|nr:2-oxoglutarate dehydrogenase, E2 component, dihydrolipoamide succinyltransferase [Actinophytocola sp.]HEV2780754.1 2-oxoglutarate dehydrogenase, E2 component, dihydrolipoamide succinyltransferase [Actinophytocola sp.]